MAAISKILSFGIVLVVSYWFYQNQQTRSWPAVAGVITERSNVSHRSRERTYSFNVRYRYTVEGVEKEGWHSFTGGGDEADGVAVRDGLQDIQVYYDPKAPDKSTLQKGKAPFPFVPVIGLVAAVLLFKGLAFWRESSTIARA